MIPVCTVYLTCVTFEGDIIALQCNLQKKCRSMSSLVRQLQEEPEQKITVKSFCFLFSI